MCSWCWAYSPVREQLKSSLPEGVKWQNLLGGLTPDTQEPMPFETRAMVKNHWRTIQKKVGTEFNFEFWDKCNPRRATYPACRAVIAAKVQGVEERMTDAIQRAYYLRAMNPSSNTTLIQLAGELQLRKAQFAHDLTSPETHVALLAEIGQARAMGVSSFPSLVLNTGGKWFRIPHDYHSTEPTLAAINEALRISPPNA